MKEYRRTTQALAPARWTPGPADSYELYPSHLVGCGRIELGYDALAARLPEQGVVALDGFAGILWAEFRARLTEALAGRGRAAIWRGTEEALREEEEVHALIAPSLGGEDPVFGTRFGGGLADFFHPQALARLGEPVARGLVIVYGCGAALAAPGADLVYVDLPKNELQFRARAGVVTNLGARTAAPPKAAYKRSYFVDWPALQAHRKTLAGRVEWVVDAQRPDEPAMISGDALRAALVELARTSFRVRPWFEPGPWGGQWCRRNIPALPPAPNYAWSFELITPENGLMLREEDRLLEISFDWLMSRQGAEVLGESAAWFGDDFPIRFDFLDTVEGGNLSLQVHPGPGSIRRTFGERFTQDETYYILEAAPGATVNLGFQEGVRPDAFRAALERSFREGSPLEAERWVQSHPARRGDLYLIPHGTVHGAGVGNLVLEISATPYIFTYKLHDWLRPDLDGKPRPLNIERGMTSLDFARSGARVAEELISRPRVLQGAEGVTVEHLPTHPLHFYEVFRYRFRDRLQARTRGSVHVMNVVGGGSVELETPGGPRRVFHFAETFVVPAAAGEYTLRNRGAGMAEVVMARMKPPEAWPAWMGA
jgi:mannose-6-phosphate isomerase class I